MKHWTAVRIVLVGIALELLTLGWMQNDPTPVTAGHGAYSAAWCTELAGRPSGELVAQGGCREDDVTWRGTWYICEDGRSLLILGDRTWAYTGDVVQVRTPVGQALELRRCRGLPLEAARPSTPVSTPVPSPSPVPSSTPSASPSPDLSPSPSPSPSASTTPSASPSPSNEPSADPTPSPSAS